MGCCSTVKSSEEDEISTFFNKLLKENDFKFTIKNYKENYDKISKMSGNNFKKLCKKQNVCIAFIKIVKKDEKYLNDNKYKEEDINKILYYITILTILLNNKIKEDNEINDDNFNQINQFNKINLTSLKLDLISHGYNLFISISELNDINVSKIIFYYLSKMFYLCFKDIKEANNYICIKTYINKIKFIIDNNCLEDEEEYYIFIRDNLLSLGEFFHYNIYIISEEEIIDIIINLFAVIFHHHFDYLNNNFSLIKENINKNIRNTASKLMIFNNNINNKDNILPNITQTFDIINSFSININNYKNINDINLIIENLYYFLAVSAQDINSGKILLNSFGNKLNEKNKKTNDYKFNDIILLLLFYECCIKDNEKLTLCLLEYITDLILNNDSNIQINENNIYYDIILDSYYLIYKNETLIKKYISLLSQIFMKEIENNSKSPLFITQLIQIYHKKEKMINKLIKLFFIFLVNISQYYKEKINFINNDDNIISKEINDNKTINENILINLNSIIKTNFINNNNDNNYNNYICSSTNNVSYNIYSNKDFINKIKIQANDYQIIIDNFFNFNKLKEEELNNIEFYLYFHIFIINNMDITELTNEFSKKEYIYHKLFKIINQLEIRLIQNSIQENNHIRIDKEDNNSDNCYINYILMAIQILLKIIEGNDSKYYIQDCYIFYKLLENNTQSLLEMKNQIDNGNNEINFFYIKIIYSIIFFILTQFIRLIHIPNSIEKIHKEILYCINKTNEKCEKYLSEINISKFISNNKLIEPNIQYLKEILLSKDENNNDYIDYNTLKQILDIIYSKLFGKDTSLHIFFDNQVLNQKYFYNIRTNSNYINVSKESDNITEVKDNSIINFYDNNYSENYIDNISIHIVESKNKQKSNNNENDNLNISQNSNINVPINNDNNSTDARNVTNSFINDEKNYQNIKV